MSPAAPALARPVVTRIGPPSATEAGEARVGREAVTLVVQVEVWGAGDRREAIETALAAGILASFRRARGGTTARLRAALAAADAWLRERAPEPPRGAPELGAGASVLALTGDTAILAQVGPALAFGAGGDGPQQHPASSPWLRPGAGALTPAPLWTPLGQGGPPDVQWAQWSLGPGGAALLVPSGAAGALPLEVVAPILGAPSRSALAELAAILPPGMAAVHVARGPGRTSGGTAAPAATAAPVPAAVGAQTPLPAAGTAATAGAGGRRPRLPDVDREALAEAARRAGASLPEVDTEALAEAARRVAATLRALGARASRSGARALAGTLPARAAEGADSYRVERARLAAAAAVLLPLGVLALTVTMRSRAGPLVVAGTVASGDPASPDDPALRITRLADLAPVMALAGEAPDERRVVVGGAPYVLDTVLDRVDRLADGIATPVLARGRAVGDDVVAELVDLFWLPAPGGAGGSAVVLDAADRLWALDGERAALVARAEAPVWGAARAAAGYEGHLYALDRSAGQIWRYARGPAVSFPTAGTAWLAAEADFGRAIDLAIDGAIYVLLEGGRIRKFAGGREAPFDVAPPGSVTDARDLYTSPTAGRLLVADRGGGRIVALSPDGAFLGQLLRPAQSAAADAGVRAGRFGQIEALWWDETAGTLYVVDGNVLYRAAYR